jgi:hypothetical protein
VSHTSYRDNTQRGENLLLLVRETKEKLVSNKIIEGIFFTNNRMNLNRRNWGRGILHVILMYIIAR